MEKQNAPTLTLEELHGLVIKPSEFSVPNLPPKNTPGPERVSENLRNAGGGKQTNAHKRDQKREGKGPLPTLPTPREALVAPRPRPPPGRTTGAKHVYF